jgi:adhesin transport system membrane fusion protein
MSGKVKQTRVSREAHHLSARLVIPAVAIVLVAFLIWAAWAEIDQVTRVNGTVITASRNQVIQPMQRSRVEEIMVREGDEVVAGQVLVRFDRTRAEASWRETRAQVASREAIIARLEGELAGRPPKFPELLNDYPGIVETQRALYQRRQESLKREVESLASTLALIEDELALTEPLLASGDVSEVEVLRLKRQSLETQSKITNRRNQYYQQVQTELSEAESELESLRQQLIEQEELVTYTSVHSPMNGVVRNVQVNTRGGVVQAGQEIMQIVPVQDDYVIEAEVLPKDIAYVRPGLPATVKFGAYDFMVYGSFPGEVTFISADTIEDEAARARGQDRRHYQVHVRVAGKDLIGMGPEPVEVQPGMTATVEIKTGDNTVLGFLSKPIVRGVSESFGER